MAMKDLNENFNDRHNTKKLSIDTLKLWYTHDDFCEG